LPAEALRDAARAAGMPPRASRGQLRNNFAMPQNRRKTVISRLFPEPAQSPSENYI
jgi:hypothetical protein